MITLERFLSAVQENVARVRRYESGHDGSDGGCDCIGLIIGAIRLAGGKWTGTHGSNWTARNGMDGLNWIEDGSQCFLGEIVYKAKEPGEEGYSLPGTYASSPDKRDYYHVGVVTKIDPLTITHCTGVDGGIKRDTALGKWRWGGKLKYVDYDGSAQEEPLYTATVTADNGYPVKMRSGPGTDYKILATVPLGTIVEVNDVLDGWCRITYDGVGGYMMDKFLSPVGAAPLPDNAVTVDKAALKAARAALKMALDAIDGVLDGGGAG